MISGLVPLHFLDERTLIDDPCLALLDVSLGLLKGGFAARHRGRLL
jgi:hypothetical protein